MGIGKAGFKQNLVGTGIQIYKKKQPFLRLFQINFAFTIRMVRWAVGNISHILQFFQVFMVRGDGADMRQGHEPLSAHLEMVPTVLRRRCKVNCSQQGNMPCS